MTLFFELVVVSLNDWACNKSDFVLLGDVLSLCGVFTVFVQPILGTVSIVSEQMIEC